MGRLSFAIYDAIEIYYKTYQVIGMIEFKNDSDRKTWREYKLKCSSDGKIYWLSIDLCYKEYALYSQVKYEEKKHSDGSIVQRGYKEVDSFKATVNACNGDVDVSIGDGVFGTEYEDNTEELIISIEQWGDEIEYSEGYYLDAHRIMSANKNSIGITTSNKNKGNNPAVMLELIKLYIFTGVIIGIPILSLLYGKISQKDAIQKYLRKSNKYTYETSITSSGAKKEKAQVYKSDLSLGETVRDIIDNIDGNTENVSENNEEDDNSVVIVTDDEYCLMYESEDEEVLVQVSSRLYTYTSDSSPYRCRATTRSFYRGYYYQNIYDKDSRRYRGYKSYYSDADT